MGLFEKIFKSPQERIANNYIESFFKTFNAYTPRFTSWGGGLYESELVRASLDARARHIAKLSVDFDGSAKLKLQTQLKKHPNEFQTWYQFMYRLSTILDMQNTAFIVPIVDEMNEMVGVYPVLPSQCEILQDKLGNRWLKYTFNYGQVGYMEMNRCGVMTKFQYKDDFFGETNRALNPTMDLISMQNQGIKEGIRSSASFRIMAKLTNFKDPADLKKEQTAFSASNFSRDAGGGVLLMPNTWTDIQQMKSTPFTIPVEQVALIQKNVFNYFGVNEEILQNSAIGDKLDGFFDGCIEPFAIQFSEVLTKMLFTDLEQGHGSRAYATANKLQYMTTANKIQFVREMCDRGLISINEARELLNYNSLGLEGDRLPIRGEYKLLGNEEPKEETEDGSEN